MPYDHTLAEYAMRREQLQGMAHEIKLRGPMKTATVAEQVNYNPIGGPYPMHAGEDDPLGRWARDSQEELKSEIVNGEAWKACFSAEAPKTWGVPLVTTEKDPITGSDPVTGTDTVPRTPRTTLAQERIIKMTEQLRYLASVTDENFSSAVEPDMFRKELPSAGTGYLSRTMPKYDTAPQECLSVATRMEHWKYREQIQGRGDRQEPAQRVLTDREIQAENRARMKEQIAALNADTTKDSQHEVNPVWDLQMPPMFYNCEVDGVMHPIRGTNPALTPTLPLT